MPRITKAVIPVAGLGTRFLPATKAMPKEMLPVVDKPIIQYVVEEAVAANTLNILMVTGRNKNALENHFDRAVEIETRLVENGDQRRLSAVSAPTELANIHYVRQGDALGLGHAVAKAKAFVGNEAFALLLGDEIIHREEDLLSSMVSLAENEFANVIALMEVQPEEVEKYGIATVADNGDDITHGKCLITSLVEKPKPELAPSRLAVVGRYVLQPGVFEILENTAPGVSGEIQLTDALDLMARNPEIAGPVYGYVIRGRRFDMGNQLSYLKAVIELASERSDIGKPLKSWLKEFSQD